MTPSDGEFDIYVISVAEIKCVTEKLLMSLLCASAVVMGLDTRLRFPFNIFFFVLVFLVKVFPDVPHQQG